MKESFYVFYCVKFQKRSHFPNQPWKESQKSLTHVQCRKRSFMFFFHSFIAHIFPSRKLSSTNRKQFSMRLLLAKAKLNKIWKVGWTLRLLMILQQSLRWKICLNFKSDQEMQFMMVVWNKRKMRKSFQWFMCFKLFLFNLLILWSNALRN